jgi:creatinine amidohydrolase
MKRKVLWAEMRRPELEEALRQRAVVVLPVGAIEQHGPHLPVDTDTNSVTEIAVRVAESLAEPRVLVLPTIAYGLSPHHMGFVGTITLRFDTLVAVVRDVCRSVHAHGFRKLVILNGHGGNSALLNAVAASLVEERIFVASLTYWTPIAADLREVGESALGGMSHACEMETSVQLHLRPQLVDMASAFAAPVVPLTSFFFHDFRAPGSVTYTADFKLDAVDGIRGDPTVAKAETGERILDAAVARIGQFLREFASIPER